MLISSQDRAVKLKPNDGKNIMIRITTPCSDFKELQYKDSYADILEVKFHDITRLDVQMMGNPSTPSVITDQQGKTMFDFFLKHRDADFLLIHCEAGVSRSAAVALAFLTYLKREENIDYVWKNYVPNISVANSILKNFTDDLLSDSKDKYNLEDFDWDNMF